MRTPICDFVNEYAKSESIRLHMPGHKGKNIIGIESFDITEINGADSLYDAEGIIKESEKIASFLFGCDTFYSAEGSSQCIRAMMFLISFYAKNIGRKPLILAGRNAHKTFLSAAALIDFDIKWIYPHKNESYLSCKITANEIDDLLKNMTKKPVAVYLTNPDYLGNCVDIKSISDVCRKHGVLLAVDNAHGAYLKFLTESKHPIDLGADICCDSAHKTLPVLTGGAYIHLSEKLSCFFKENVKNALELFGSTSPSYVILQSLDAANKYISDGYAEKLQSVILKVSELKNDLIKAGYSFIGDELLKLTFDIKKYGYIGTDFSDLLADNNIFCEFADPDYVVMMFTPEISNESFSLIKKILLSVPKKNIISSVPPDFKPGEKIMSVREAVFSSYETVSAEKSEGRVLSVSDVGCPPAVPVIISGERIDAHAVKCFKYYGIKKCNVLK